MNTIIFTEESGVKLPEIHKWKGTYSKGFDVTKDPDINSLLTAHNLVFPSNNVDLEDQYREVLHDFIRQPIDMFGGSFGEVRLFAKEISQFTSTKINIISSRYGLLREDEEIIPYSCSSKEIEEIQLLDEKTNFSQKMFDETIGKGLMIILLPLNFILYLLRLYWFAKLNRKSHIIIVSSKRFETIFLNYPNVVILERKGVTRIGLKNQQKILQIVKSL